MPDPLPVVLTARSFVRLEKDHPAFASNIKKAAAMMKQGYTKEEIITALGKFVYQEAVEFSTLHKRSTSSNGTL